MIMRLTHNAGFHKGSLLLAVLPIVLAMQPRPLQDRLSQVSSREGSAPSKPEMPPQDITCPNTVQGLKKLFKNGSKSTIYELVGDYKDYVLKAAEVNNKNQMELNIYNFVKSRYMIPVEAHAIGKNGKQLMLMRKVENGSLYDYVTKKPNHLTEDEARPLMACLIQGLYAMHANNIIHGDPKPDNILMIDDCTAAAWCDFEHSARFEGANGEVAEKDIPEGSPGFYSPELAQLVEGGVTRASDLFCLGKIFYFMLHGVSPIPKLTTLLQFVAGIHKVQDIIGEHVSPAAADLITRLVALEINDRIGMDETIDESYNTLQSYL